MKRALTGNRLYLSGHRAVELDFLRGFAIFMMILHHGAFDLRFIFQVPHMEFEGSFVVDDILRPIFLMIFLGVSGIASSFSKNNAKRGVRLLGVALVFSVATFVINRYIIGMGVIYFNVLHNIALMTLLYAWITHKEETEQQRRNHDTLMLILAGMMLFYGLTWPDVTEMQVLNSYYMLPFGFLPTTIGNILDYLPLLPWGGFYLLGAVIGRNLYRDRASRFPGTTPLTLRVLSPFLFIGRHSLIVYLLHQPVVLGALMLLQRLFHIFPAP